MSKESKSSIAHICSSPNRRQTLRKKLIRLFILAYYVRRGSLASHRIAETSSIIWKMTVSIVTCSLHGFKIFVIVKIRLVIVKVMGYQKFSWAWWISLSYEVVYVVMVLHKDKERAVEFVCQSMFWTDFCFHLIS